MLGAGNLTFRKVFLFRYVVSSNVPYPISFSLVSQQSFPFLLFLVLDTASYMISFSVFGFFSPADRSLLTSRRYLTDRSLFSITDKLYSMRQLQTPTSTRSSNQTFIWQARMFSGIFPLLSFAFVHLSCADPSTSIPQNQPHNFLRWHDPRGRRLQAAITKSFVHNNWQPITRKFRSVQQWRVGEGSSPAWWSERPMCVVPAACKVADIHIPPTSPDVTDLWQSSPNPDRKASEKHWRAISTPLKAKLPNLLPRICRYTCKS